MEETKNNFSFKKYAWTQFKKNKIALICLYLLGALVFIALFAPYIANDRPLYAKYKIKLYTLHLLKALELIQLLIL